MIYYGVITDNNDPLKYGRVKVRIVGIHPTDNSITSDDLPWCHIISPLSFGGNSGLGISSVPIQGTSVYLLIEDNNYEHPLILGAVRGNNTKTPEDEFKDKDSKYPLSNYFGKGDLSGLTTENFDLSSALSARKDGVIDGEAIEITSSAKYPYNNVIETQSGHTIILDDTEGNEHITILHKNGDYVEITDNELTVKSKTKVQVIAPEIDLGGASTEPLVLGDKLKAYIDDSIVGKFKEFLDNDYSTHIHPTGVGPSGPPSGTPTVEFGDFEDDILSEQNKSK